MPDDPFASSEQIQLPALVLTEPTPVASPTPFVRIDSQAHTVDEKGSIIEEEAMKVTPVADCLIGSFDCSSGPWDCSTTGSGILGTTLCCLYMPFSARLTALA